MLKIFKRREDIFNKLILDQANLTFALSLDVILACLVGALIWNVPTWILGIPSSSSHALIGRMVGEVLAGAGYGAIKLHGLEKVVIALVTSPLLGFVVGFVLMRLINFLVRNVSNEFNKVFKNGQLITALGMGHGIQSRDERCPKDDGHYHVEFGNRRFHRQIRRPTVGGCIERLGTALGGWKLIRTLGGRFYKICPINSFTTQLTFGAVILVASFLGLPVSTSQVVSSAIIGVESSESFGNVCWSVAEEIVTAWFITIPASALVSAGCIG